MDPQNLNARYLDKFTDSKTTSVRIHHPPGGASSFSLGWQEPEKPVKQTKKQPQQYDDYDNYNNNNQYNQKEDQYNVKVNNNFKKGAGNKKNQYGNETYDQYDGMNSKNTNAAGKNNFSAGNQRQNYKK